ncbi:hypothetical protein ME1_01206 [Bartonella vinsonii subsp. arupensis OK-94-513]|uniref:Uncharacterized protein n=2 Tax=Bartonella vinsonii subsp. arupensis TaxID=110578 RepID=J0QWQ5_BARVI|nr:hypothetical protein [Bartonella vinsonii]EJF87604.1 hypothetical protein ME1_01206 [Bartonella vinsonii subsp. arupensis OK-94-513]EJF98685.1 hypothetical protein MEI_00255 [Bartonella vinsonii subsp. arupensis Pm136co]
MFRNSILCILITVVFLFAQIVEVNANLWKGRTQENLFIAVVAQEKDIFVQVKNRAVMSISDQNAGENYRFIIRQQIEKAVFSAIAFFLGRLALKAVRVLKRWAGAALSQAFEDWRDSLYH